MGNRKKRACSERGGVLAVVVLLLTASSGGCESQRPVASDGEASQEAENPTAQAIARAGNDFTPTQQKHDESRLFEAYPVNLPPDHPEHVRRFGEEHANPIENDDCVFFLQGRYVEAPYRVSRVGLGIYINGQLLTTCQWLRPSYVATDPPVPVGLTKRSSIAEVAERQGNNPSWKALKYRYLHSHYPPAEADERYLEALRSLPFVKELGIDPHPELGIPRLKIVTFRGEVCRSLLEEVVDYRPYATEDVTKELKQYFRAWQENVQMPGFWWGGQGFRRFSKQWRHVPEVVEILKSEEAAKDKARLLRPLVYQATLPAAHEQLEAQLRRTVKNFKNSEQLDTRVERIRKQREEWQKEQEKKKVRPPRMPGRDESIARSPSTDTEASPDGETNASGVGEKVPVGLAPNHPDRIRRFGEVHAEPIENEHCILFLRGRYIEAPYRVSRIGLGVYVNDVLVKEYEWPGSFYVADDPPVPKSLTRDSTFAELSRDLAPGRSWVSLKAKFLYSHFPPDEAWEKLIEAHRRLPFVKTVVVERHRALGCPVYKAITFDGEERCGLQEISADMRPMEPKYMQEHIEAAFEGWKKSLRAGGFIWGTGKFSRGTEEWYRVPDIVEILKSDASAAGKSKRLSPYFSKTFLNTPEIEEIEARRAKVIKNFRGSPQLDSRVEALQEEREDWRKEQEKKKARPPRLPRPGEPIARVPNNTGTMPERHVRAASGPPGPGGPG